MEQLLPRQIASLRRFVRIVYTRYMNRKYDEYVAMPSGIAQTDVFFRRLEEVTSNNSSLNKEALYPGALSPI